MLGVVDHEDEGGPPRLGRQQLRQGVPEEDRRVTDGHGPRVEQSGAHPLGQLVERLGREGGRDERGPVTGGAQTRHPDADRVREPCGDEVEDGGAAHAPRAVERDSLTVERPGGDRRGEPAAAHRGSSARGLVPSRLDHSCSSVVGGTSPT